MTSGNSILHSTLGERVVTFGFGKAIFDNKKQQNSPLTLTPLILGLAGRQFATEKVRRTIEKRDFHSQWISQANFIVHLFEQQLEKHLRLWWK